MTTATMILDRTIPLEPGDKMGASLAEHLGEIGLIAIGVRGNVLVIRVQDQAKLPDGSFREALRSALNEVPGFWERFDSASFN